MGVLRVYRAFGKTPCIFFFFDTFFRSFFPSMAPSLAILPNTFWYVQHSTAVEGMIIPLTKRNEMKLPVNKSQRSSLPFPSFSWPPSQVDEEFARQCLDQRIALLRGPPNRPTASLLSSEQKALLRTAVDFLSEQGGSSGQDDGDGDGDEDGGGNDDDDDSHDVVGGDGGSTIPLNGTDDHRRYRYHHHFSHHGAGVRDSNGRVVDDAVASLLSEVSAATATATTAAGHEEGGDTTAGSGSDGDGDYDYVFGGDVSSGSSSVECSN